MEMMNMKVLFIVLNSEDHLDDLLIKFDSSGIHGGTIVNSLGMAQEMVDHSQGATFNYIRGMMSGGRPQNKTIFLVLPAEKLDTAKQCVREVVGDLNGDNIGIMFDFTIDNVEGLTK
ncbi:MAG TPA: hypothetical protein VK107_02915 [Alloiococcus sp.]|nr:hypothetical protein [Alloiococcus sp.]